MLKISIITVCYNSEKYIEQTIQSVIYQNYKNIEYIIVDGLSKDRTVDIINRYRDKVTTFIQGKDKNMYDAINKGMKASTGDYIAILNSDDYLMDADVITKVANAIDEDGQRRELYYCNHVVQYMSSGLMKKQRKIQTSFKELLCSKHLAFTGHGTGFVSKEVVKEIGYYDCDSFRAAADYDYFLRIFKRGNVKHINVDLEYFRMHDESITSTGQIDVEKLQVLKNHGYYDIPSYYRKLYFMLGWGKYLFFNAYYLAKNVIQKL